MANEPKVLFEIDASKILAKLHYGGKMAAGADADSFIVNTGIKDDTDNGNPDDPGKTTFDLTNAQGQYEIGYVTVLKYSKKNSVFRDVLADYAKNSAQIQTKSEDQTLQSDNSKTDKEQAEFEKAFINKWKKQGEDVLSKFKGKSGEEITKQLDAIEKDSNKEADGYNAQLEKIKASASDKLKLYMTNFAGPDAGKKITVQALFMINIADSIKDSNDKDLVANYEIQPISDKDKELMLKKFQADPSKCVERVCFKVKYTIDIEK